MVSKETVSSRVPHCKMYIKAMVLTKPLKYGVTKDRIPTFVIYFSHGFTFVG